MESARKVRGKCAACRRFYKYPQVPAADSSEETREQRRIDPHDRLDVDVSSFSWFEFSKILQPLITAYMIVLIFSVNVSGAWSERRRKALIRQPVPRYAPKGDAQ